MYIYLRLSKSLDTDETFVSKNTCPFETNSMFVDLKTQCGFKL